MRKVAMACVLAAAIGGMPALGHEPGATEPAAPASGSSASWWDWNKMLGDWGGARTQLAEGGVTVDIGVTQIIQHNASGGRATHEALKYSGSADITLNFDTAKLGLWKGGNLMLNAEPKWGDGVNAKVGSLVPVNMDAIKPGAGEGAQFTLSEWIYSHVLFDGKLILIGGKLDGSRAFDTNVFANDERRQFLNVALRNNVMIPPFLPYTDWGFGFILKPTEWVTVTAALADSEGRAKTTGFETAFHGPTHTTSINEVAFHLKPFDKPGNYRVGMFWSSMETPLLKPPTPFRQTGPMMIGLLGPKLAQKVVGMIAPKQTNADNVGMYLNFDQWVYTEADDPQQGVGLFGRFGWARSDVNPVEWFYSVGVGGKGLLPSRDNDTFGIGYYYISLSDDMPALFHKEAGVELYYNIEVAEWCHVTPDIQIIKDPGGTTAHDVAFVYGVRVQLDL